MINYIYEGEYDPALPDDSVSDAASAATAILTGGKRKKSSDGKSKKVATPSASFPHTCSDGNYGCCNNPSVCAHHYCGSDCGYDCNNYRCKDCHIEALALAISGSSEQLLVHAKLYEITDKYDVMGLKDLLAEKFKRACQRFWNEPVFAVAAHHAFSTTPDSDQGLRDIVSATIAAHMTELVKKPEVEALLTEFNGLAVGLLKMKTEAGWK